MSAPTAYARQKNFTDYAISHPEAPFNASDLDAELNALLITLQGVLANRVLIQRDDGALKNDSVHPDSLSTATLLLIEAAGDAEGLADLVRGLWVTATAYTPGQIVQNLTSSYICAIAHTSGTFDTDYVAGKWIILGETFASGASGISFSPAGNIVAITIQAAIEELDADKAKKEGDANQVFSVDDATGAAHAPNMGQIQKNTLKTAIATGSGNALLATIESGLTTLTDGMEFVIEAPGSNTLTIPTLNLTLGTTATGAKTIVKGNNLPVIAGDIASNKCVFCYDLSLDKWVLLNPVFSVGVSSSDATAGQPKNLGLAFAVGGNAISATLVTGAGSIPTAADQIRVPMPSSNPASGTFNVRTISASIGLTISSGSTLGHASATASTIHWYLIDNAGTLELAASTTYYGTSGIATTAAEGGAGAADSATTMYSTTARSNVPCLWIAETTDTQTDAGIWLSAPSAVRLVDLRASSFARTLLDDASAAAARLTLLIEPPIFPLTASVAGNAMTLTLNPCAITFRDYIPASSAIYTDVVSAPISTTISAGSTGGSTNGNLSRIYVFALYYASTIELGWINVEGGNALSEEGVITTFAELGNADLAATPYSTSARANVPYRMVGYIESTQAVAGTWATAPSRIVGGSRATLSNLYGLGSGGQVWTNVAASRAVLTTYVNTTGRPILVTISGTINTANATSQLTINGVVVAISTPTYTTGVRVGIQSALIPAGASYSIAPSVGTLTIGTWMELR
jgi:hypothetical protein